MGGSVKGGQILGSYPSDLSQTSNIRVNRALIPTMSWEGMWHGLAQWFGVHDDLMRVPGKPLGFLAASTIEYHPARPEAHRSTVLAGQKLHSSRPPKPRELPVKMSLRHK